MRASFAIVAAYLVLGTGITAQSVQPQLLDSTLKPMNVEGKTLPETVKLLAYASGVPVRMAQELEACATSDRPGCDWRIHTTWGERQTLQSAISTLCRSAKLTYTVVDGAILLSRRVPKAE